MNDVFDFRRFEAMYDEWEAGFQAGSGPGDFSYARGGPVSIYGTTDMLISRFIIGRLNPDESEKDSWASRINSFQNPKSGWYRKRYTWHFRSHTAAYAAAALKLIGRSPEYPVRRAETVARSPEATRRWLRSIPWSLVWPGSHIAAGLPAIRIMDGRVDNTAGGFLDNWRSWLEERVHPETGFWSRGMLHKTGLISPFRKEEMGGAFHMYFIYEALGQPWPLPEKVVDTTLALQNANGFWDGDASYCIDLDGIWCLTRSSRNAAGYRAGEVREACRRYLQSAEATLNNREFLFSRYDNSHRLTGALAAIAECATFYPDMVRTGSPWKQSLDTACFI